MKTKTDKDGEEYVVFSYRIPADKYEKVKTLAKNNKRSINAEIDMAVDKYIESQEKN